MAALAGQIVPYATAALSAYGGAVLARVQDDAADATVGLGRRLLRKAFGPRYPGEPLPGPLTDLAADPSDPDATEALKLHLRELLSATPGLADELRSVLDNAGIAFIAAGDRSAAIQSNSGIVSTGDHATIRQTPP